MENTGKPTTLVVDKETHQLFKIYCASKGILMKTLIKQLIENEMSETKKSVIEKEKGVETPINHNIV
jgi:hypothetical protein